MWKLAIMTHQFDRQYFLKDYLIVSAARSLTCRDDLDSKWRLLLAENELSRVSLLSQYNITVKKCIDAWQLIGTPPQCECECG